MQIRCQHCGSMLTLSREALSAALEATVQTETKHYDVECPKCRHQIKVPVKDIQRFRPQKTSEV